MPPRDPALPSEVTATEPRLRLRLLGAVELRNASGTELVAVVRQPKRLALLAFLALRPGGRWVRRDELLATFWPDLDARHARASLRRALYFLRQELGEGIVAGRGSEELGVLPAALWCDVTVFQEALARREWERALELYRGDLLQGIFIAGADEADRWLERERGALRTAAGDAAGVLARAAGGWEAVEWSRRALALSPCEDASVQRLMQQLAGLGDRAGALRSYQEFARRLKTDLDLDPDAATEELATKIRAMETVPHPLAAVTESGVKAVPHLVLVGPIHFRGTDRYAYLGPALTELLASTIHGAGPYHTVDPSIVTAHLAGSGVPAAAAHRFRASHQVTGTIIEVAGRFRAAITLTDAAGLNTRIEEDAEAEAGLFELADRLSRRILSALGVSDRLPVNSTGIRMTNSLRAIRSWMTAEYAFRQGKARDAVSALRDVVREDPEFALAHYRLGCAMASAGMLPDALRAMDQAAARQERLSDHDRRLVAAHRAWLAGDLAEADLQADTLVLGYPESLQGWFLVGDIRFHGNPDRGRSVIESRSAFERVLELDPEHTGALLHLVRLDALEHSPAQACLRIARLLKLRPNADHAVALQALYAFLLDDVDGQAAVLSALGQASGQAMVEAFVEVSVTARNLAGAERLGRAMLRNARSDHFRALCHVAVAHVLLAAGRIDDAFAELETLPALRAGWAVGARALLRTLPFVTTPREALERDREILVHAVAPEPPTTLPSLLEIHDALSAHLRQFLLGLLSARLGDEPAVLQAIEQLSELAVPEGAGRLLEYMDRTLRAEVLRARGKPREALDALGPARQSLWHQAAMFSPVFAGVHQRALRAMLLADLGRTAEAEGWWKSMAERSPFELVVMTRGPLTSTRML